MLKARIEKELKCSLTKEEYTSLLCKLNFSKQSQVNHYFLADNKYPFRFRYLKEEDKYLFTCKIKLAEGHQEYETYLDSINFDDPYIKELVEQLEIKNIRFVGISENVRHLYKGEKGEFCLDNYLYCEKEDYEFEYELYDSNDSYEEAESFLKENKIEIKIPESKFSRFLKEKENYYKIAFLCADGLEECECLLVYDLCLRAGVKCELISISDNKNVVGSHNIEFKCVKTIKEIDKNEYNCLYLPGGKVGTDNLFNSQKVKELIKDFVTAKKIVAAVCAAPSILYRQGYLKDNHFTVYPGFEFNGVSTGNKVEIDNNFITGKGLGACYELAEAIISELKNKEVAINVLKQIQLLD